MTRAALTIALLLIVPALAHAQWPARQTPGLPRTADGKPDLKAPAPRSSDGRPDLSGLWTPEPDPTGTPEGVENAVFPRYLNNVLQDVADPDGLLVSDADRLYQQRLANNGVDDPIAHCQPAGSARIFSLPRPTKIIHTPGLTLLLHEHDSTFRQVFTDGRSLPTDALPTWLGYSIGRWDGDSFVVTTTGLTERSWLDLLGHPHTDKLVLTERFRRVDTGHLQVQVTYEDPGTFTKPVTITQTLRLLADQEFIEYFCSDNEKDRPHYQAK